MQSNCKDCQRAYREHYRAKAIENTFEGNLTCAKCGNEKHCSKFAKAASKTGFSSWCKECKKEYQDAYEYTGGYRNRRKERVAWLHDIKRNQSCIDCNEIYEPICMDFDHIEERGVKIKTISRMVLDNTKKDIILKEIDKCELVCVLCHNKRTKERLNKRYPNTKYSSTTERNIKIINDAKSVPCCICKESRDLCNMQFDHLDPSTKFKDICQLKNFKTATLQAEIAKCQVICALCHRRKSIIEQQFGLYPKKREDSKKRLFIDIENEKKECYRCNNILDFSEFRKRSQTKLSLDSWCKECFNTYRREKRAEQKPGYIELK